MGTPLLPNLAPAHHAHPLHPTTTRPPADVPPTFVVRAIHDSETTVCGVAARVPDIGCLVLLANPSVLERVPAHLMEPMRTYTAGQAFPTTTREDFTPPFLCPVACMPSLRAAERRRGTNNKQPSSSMPIGKRPLGQHVAMKPTLDKPTRHLQRRMVTS